MGIDFGTTRTVVAAAGDGRHPIASFEIDGEYRDWIPGVVASRDGALSFGWDALASPGADAVVRSLKREVAGLAPDDAVTSLPSRPSALALATGFVEHLVRMIRSSSCLDVDDGEPIEAMIAVPANATSRQRWLTIEAFRRGGVEVLGVLNEPTAAGIEFAFRHLGTENRRSPKRYVVVYDLGGGTFDTSAISLAGRRFELLATEGLARLGGDDFDAAILELAVAEHELDLSDSPLHAALLDQSRAAKEAMTAQSKNVMVDLGAVLPDGAPVVLPAAAVLAACEPLVARTMELVDKLFLRLPEHGIDPENSRELGAVYVVGGGAAFPGVARALRAKHGRKLQLAPIPHAATAIGLAVAADPDAGVYVHEAVTRHFGVWREAEGGREKTFDPIFAKDAKADDGELVVRRRYRPRHTVGHLRFLECSEVDAEGGPAGDLTPWREVFFPYDPTLRDRDGDLARAVAPATALSTEEIIETYRYGERGDITVRIENVTHGYARTYELGRMG